MLSIKNMRKLEKSIKTIAENHLRMVMINPVDSFPMSNCTTLDDYVNAISTDFGINCKYVNGGSLETPVWYKRRECGDYTIHINKDKDEKELVIQLITNLMEILIYDFPSDVREASPYTGFFEIRTKDGEELPDSALFYPNEEDKPECYKRMDPHKFIPMCLTKEELKDTLVWCMPACDIWTVDEVYDFPDRIMFKFTIANKEHSTRAERLQELFMEISKKTDVN